MLRKFFCLLLLTTVLLQNNFFAQKKTEIKFGKITIADFTPQSPAIDSGSDAVVLADIGSSEFEGNSNGYFSLIFKQQERILLKSRNAFEEATVKVPLYTWQSQFAEKFEDFEAVTYNLENGKIIETRLDKNSIYKEKYNRYFTTIKFTLPDLKEGSIIEYKFTVRSPFNNNNIRSWSFQGKYPVLWSEYQVTIPPIFNYVTLRQGYLPYAIDSVAKVFKNYTILDPGEGVNGSSTVYHLSGDAIWAYWAMKDVHAFKEESYISSSENYIPKIKFQLHSIKYNDTYIKQVMKDWYTTVDDLMKDEDFGKPLADQNSWLQNDLKNICGGTEGLDKARKIFEYVRDNFTCTDYDARDLSGPLKKIYQSRKGNVADINLLLTAMLISGGFEAHPILLSTRENGRPNESEAVLSQYNYVITRLTVDSAFYLLDASVSRLGFGKLTDDCYNGSGRLISKPPYLLPLTTDSLQEEKNTSVFIINDDNGNVIGSYTSNLGYFESLNVRDKLAKTKQDDFLKEITKSYPSEVEISNMVIDSIKLYDEPVSIKYDMKLKFDDDMVYFSPLFNESWKKNLFTSAKRLYPVEMPYKINETYVLNMEVPKGYKVDELPKSTKVKLNENEGYFEYIIANTGGKQIQLRCRLTFNKANFTPNDYQTLRDFFTYVVKKENEQIVFKKGQ
jgi:hypothetical protein